MATFTALLLVAITMGTILIALSLFPAFILMLAFGILASMTGWACAISFLPCLLIVIIIGLFL